MKVMIPAFLNAKFSECKTKEEKDEFLKAYNNWKSLELTEEFVSYLEQSLSLSISEEDKENLFTTLFQSKYFRAGKKAERNLLRRLIKQIKG